MNVAVEFPVIPKSALNGPQDQTAVNAVRTEMFLAFCASLESHNISYVILAGYQGYPDCIDSDVDFMVSESDFRRLPKLLNDPNNVAGGRLIQFLRHETSACYYVLAKQVSEHMAYLHPDAAAAYRRSGRLWLQSETVLATRRKAPAGFWIPAASVEFEYYFVKRVDKALVETRHLEALSALIHEDLQKCQAVLSRLLAPPAVAHVLSAIARRDTSWFAKNRNDLRAALQRSLSQEPIPQRFGSFLSDLLRKAGRVVKPTGLVIAVLGPDGSGKTTVIEHLEREFSPSFRRVKRFHLRPHFGKSSAGAAVTDPHGQAARGYAASILKVGLFLSDYWAGWLRQVLPAKIRSTFVVFDRYYHDMLVDHKRYRLPVHFRPAGWIEPLIPKPDLWLILDAKPEQLVARKGEVTLADARQLATAYKKLAHELPSAVIVDTSQPLEVTLAAALNAVRAHLEERAQDRLTSFQ